jgi:hypothetical protein
LSDRKPERAASTSGTQQISLSNVDRPQRERDARELRDRARTFREEHEDRLSLLNGDKCVFSAVDPFGAADSVAWSPLDEYLLLF